MSTSPLFLRFADFGCRLYHTTPASPIPQPMPSSQIPTDHFDSISSVLFGGCVKTHSGWLRLARARATKASEQTTTATDPLPVDPTLQSCDTELVELCERVQQDGYACYQWTTPSSGFDDILFRLRQLLSTLDLQQADDGVIKNESDLSLLQDKSGTAQGRFPPYQKSAMNWHTDGYYNAIDKTVRCFTLHCVEPATIGGELLLMDDTLLTLALHDDNPELLLLLAHPEAMTLPENRDAEGHDRPDRTVPVIQYSGDGHICTRFTTRTRNIHWRNTETKAAAEHTAQLIEQQQHWHTRVKLQRDQGIITRNLLHARTEFSDAAGQPKRQILRGRFMQLPRFNQTRDHTHAVRQ